MFFLWNPNYKPNQKLINNPNNTKNLLFIVTTQRNNPTPNLKIKFVKEYITFLELDKQNHIKQHNNNSTNQNNNTPPTTKNYPTHQYHLYYKTDNQNITTHTITHPQH